MACVLRRFFSESSENSASITRGVKTCGWSLVDRHAGAGHVVLRCDLEAELVGRGLQRIGLLIDQVGELLGGLGESLLRLLGAQFLLDFGAHLGERLGLCRLDLGDANDVKAEVGLDDLAGFARLQTEGRVFEGLDHHALAEETEIATLGG